MAGELAKVLWYYNLVPSVDTAVQKIICPIHDDINPSMILDLQDERWYCFGCSRGGDAKDLVNEIEKKFNNLNDLKSYKKYIEILKSKKVSNIKISKNLTKPHRKPNKELYLEAYDYYNCLSKVNWCEHSEVEEVCLARSYMMDRGFSPKTLNITKAKITYNNSYPIIFPMFDNGKFKGWVCRTMDKEVEAKRKYLYNTGFSRLTTLVGDYGSKDYVIVVEGYMDRLKFIQYGVSNVVAILGWKMTCEQQQKLKNLGIKTIISALDNDDYGKKGTKYLKTCFNSVVRFQYLKGIKDPGEMSQEIFNKCYRRTIKKLNEKHSEEKE